MAEIFVSKSACFHGGGGRTTTLTERLRWKTSQILDSLCPANRTLPHFSMMNLNIHDCLVTGYEALIPGIELPDPDDRHVVAAAIRTRASVIVTFNLKDFPADVLEPLGLEAQHPDEFITHLIYLNAGLVCKALKEQRAGLRNPPRSAEELLATLEMQRLPESMRHLRNFIANI